MRGFSQMHLLLWLLGFLHCCDMSVGYKKIRLQDFLCADNFLYSLQKPFRGLPKFTLTQDEDSAAIITQVWNSSLMGHLGSNNKLQLDCKFRVVTMETRLQGIYTVINLLKFRSNPTTDSCIDYIQFTDGNKPPSRPICGEINNAITFDSREREVTVHIHIEKRRLIVEPLELRMVMTAHSECDRYANDFQCNPNDTFSCISRMFYRDNITNCFGPCLDELSCFPNMHVAPDATNVRNVALSAITSLIFTMLGVVFCVWICWKYWNCITEQQRAHEASALAQRRAAREIASSIDLPTAPTFDTVLTTPSSIEMSQHQQQLQLQQQQQQMPKDLPPSYEELFPDR